MKPHFFANQDEFRSWLGANHRKESELLVGFYKVDSGIPSINWSQAVDVAIAFGWIDGIRRSIDEKSYSIRFTPRNPASNWSAVNIKKAEELIKNGLMQPEGLEVYKKRRIEQPGAYSYENKPAELPAEFEEQFKNNSKAWEYFSKQPPSYKKAIYYWILSGKRKRPGRQGWKRQLIKVNRTNESIRVMRYLIFALLIFFILYRNFRTDIHCRLFKERGRARQGHN
ncbi:MAG: YdeI/OmpD-associated family protein [Bacteroidales bacterium]